MDLKFFGKQRTAAGIGICAIFILSLPVSKLCAQAATTNMPNTAVNPIRNTMETNVPQLPGAQNVDEKVLSQMHQINLREIKAGEMAEQKGQNPEVRAYGNRLENDHQFADAMIKNLAAKDGITLPPPSDMQVQKDAVLIQKLGTAQGVEFDQMFLDAMIKGHTKAVQMLSQAQATLQDPQVRDFVGKMIPILQQHLQLAKDIKNKNVKGDINNQQTE